MASTLQRQHLAALMDYLHGERDRVHYPPVVNGQIERTCRASSITTERELRRQVAAGTLTLDCSQTVEVLCRVVGLRWPRALIDGYTGTLLQGLRHYTDPTHALIGALVVFGPGTGDHVGMVRKRGGDPEIFGNGSEIGPTIEPLTAVAARHRKPVTFLSIAGL